MTEYVNDKAGAREDLCRFLSACYYEPCVEFVDECLFDSMLAAATTLDSGLAESARKVRDAFFAQDIEALLVDYTALFIGPSQPAAMPYASFWLASDPSLRHETTMTVLDLYERGGFDVSDDFRELPDHIAAELEFLYLLIYAQNRARLGCEKDEALAADLLLRRFVGEHLGLWVGKFAKALRSVAKTAFYRELAELTERFMLIERQALPTFSDN